MSGWIRWMQQIQAIAQTGLHYSNSPYDKERYERLLDIAVEIGTNHLSISADDLREIHLQQSGYATPRVDVRAACFQEGKILLVKEGSDGRWSLPGGWADVGDKPAAAAEREVLEESGYRCAATRLLGVFDANRVAEQLSLYHAYKLLFLCEISGKEEREQSPEILDVNFFEEHEIPPLSLNRTWPELIATCFRYAKEHTLPAHFE